MKETDAQALLERLQEIHDSEKSFDHAPDWDVVKDRSSARLQCTVALRLGGILRSGASIRLVTPIDTWEGDVYGHIGVSVPGSNTELRLNPVEWRPRRDHRNPHTAPEGLALLTLKDRWHPFELNKPLGVPVFRQFAVGIAAPLPRAIAAFSDYISLCAELWKCQDLLKVPSPPWSKTLI